MRVLERFCLYSHVRCLRLPSFIITGLILLFMIREIGGGFINPPPSLYFSELTLYLLTLSKHEHTT